MLVCDRHYAYFVLLCIMRNIVMWTLPTGSINIVAWKLPTSRRNIIIVWTLSISKKCYYCVNIANKKEKYYYYYMNVANE
jgi:hypothetical protein